MGKRSIHARGSCHRHRQNFDLFRDRQALPTKARTHRGAPEELIFQARDRIETQAELDCEIEMADLVASTNLFTAHPSSAPQFRPLSPAQNGAGSNGLNPDDFGLLVIDEAHHGVASSYKMVIDYFRQNKDLKVLGVTATPDRADEEALGQMFETVAFDYEILDAIHDGWLVPVEQQFVSIAGLDFSDIRTTAGDLNGADLAAVMESEKNLYGLCAATLQIAKDRQAIVFTVSVHHAEMACEILNRHRNNCAGWICGKTQKEERRKTMKAFSDGSLQFMCNVGCLTEGVDVPNASVVIMGRPTKSRSLYAQMAGRVLRTEPNLVDQFPTADERKTAIELSSKPSALIVDFVGNSGRHKLMTSADILGGKVSDEAKELVMREARKDGEPFRVADALDEAQARLRKEAEERRKIAEARRQRLVAKVHFTAKQINPFDVLEIVPHRERGWDAGKYLSEKQRQMLIKQKVDPDAMSYTAGRQLLNELFRRINNHLCTLGQANILKKRNYDTKNMTYQTAHELIDEIATKEGWKKRNAA